ncbi:hypothetical protein ACP70R_005024 [Stipagrostis hirtigluma subsp. patula]
MPMPPSSCGGVATHDCRRELCRAAVVGDRGGAPEAVLEGLAMAGLVAVLRQLGDLAELAAEVFDDLQEQVMAAAARGRRLAARARQLEAELPPPAIENGYFCQGQREGYLHAASDTGRVDWHADLKVSHGVVAGGDTPDFIVECIERCRGPPRLSILDKYDADGEGACLKRYTNPSFFRTDSACSAKLQRRNLEGDGYLKNVVTAQQSAHYFQEIGPKFRSKANSVSADSNSEMDASDKASLGFISILRYLKHRQTNESVFPNRVKPQQIQHNFQSESSAEGRASFADHSELDISFTSSPDFNMEAWDIAADASTTIENTTINHRDAEQIKDLPMPYQSEGAGSDYGEQCIELGRTSSFEAWLSPDARFAPEHGITEESSHGTYNGNGFGSHVKQNSVTAETSCKRGDTEKRSKYRGSVGMLASRLSSLPRKLFTKQQHEPRNMAKKLLVESAAPTDTDSVRSWRSDGDGGRSDGDSCLLDAGSPSFREQLLRRAGDTCSSPDACQAYSPDGFDAGDGDSVSSCNTEIIPKEAFIPVISADPVFSVHDPVSESEECYLHDQIPLCDASADAIIDRRRNGPSISNHCSSGSCSPENCGDPATTDSTNLLLQSMKSSMGIVNETLNDPGSDVTENSTSSEDIKVVMPPLPPIPPMQWLSVRVHTGPATHRRSFRKDHVQLSEGQILKTTDFSELEVHSVEAQSELAVTNPQPEAQTHFQEEVRQKFKSGDFNCKRMQVPDQSTKMLNEDHEASYLKGTEISSCHGNTVPVSEVNKLTNAEKDNVQNSRVWQSDEGYGPYGSDPQKESEFFSAVEQLAKIAPPSVPRPKFSLLEVAFHHKMKLRNGPSMIHPSRNILDRRNVLQEHIKDKSFILKPVLGMSSDVTGSPMNPSVATILQRADDIRQAHMDDNDVDSEDSWSDSD